MYRRQPCQSPARAVVTPAAMNPTAESSPPMPKMTPAIQAPVSSTLWWRTRNRSQLADEEERCAGQSEEETDARGTAFAEEGPLRMNPSTATKTSTCNSAPEIDMGTRAALEKG